MDGATIVMKQRGTGPVCVTTVSDDARKAIAGVFKTPIERRNRRAIAWNRNWLRTRRRRTLGCQLVDNMSIVKRRRVPSGRQIGITIDSRGGKVDESFHRDGTPFSVIETDSFSGGARQMSVR